MESYACEGLWLLFNGLSWLWPEQRLPGCRALGGARSLNPEPGLSKVCDSVDAESVKGSDGLSWLHPGFSAWQVGCLCLVVQ